MPTKSPKPWYELEYNSLRSEVLKRIELRQQIVSITLTLAGAFLGIGLGTTSVALIYPPLAMFLAFGWAQNDFRIRNLTGYLRKNLESSATGLHYEHEVQVERERANGLGSWRFVVISHIGIFLFTQAMALMIELARIEFNLTLLSLTQWILLVIGILSMLVVSWIARLSVR